MKTPNVFPDVEIKGFHAKLARLWDASASDAIIWDSDIPEAGQSVVTALILQDVFGGTLLQTSVNDDFHYWNLMPDGVEADLTRAQYAAPTVFGEVEEVHREHLLASSTDLQRYRILSDRLKLEN